MTVTSSYPIWAVILSLAAVVDDGVRSRAHDPPVGWTWRDLVVIEFVTVTTWLVIWAYDEVMRLNQARLSRS